MATVRLPLGLTLLLVAPVLAGQTPPVSDSARVLLLEHHFPADSPSQAVATLRQHVVYWAYVTGPGTPAFQPEQTGRAALVLLVDSTSMAGVRRFEVHAFRDGPHVVTMTDLPGGTAATLRLYQDVVETQRITENRERVVTLGALLAGGFHSGYRLDPTGGADPRGGADYEACLLLETGSRLSTCLGATRQMLPDAGYNVTWLFIEERARVATAALVGGRRTDFAVALRYSSAPTAGPRTLNPGMLGAGVYVIQHLSARGLRHGVRIVAGWQHGRLGNAPETEFLDTNRFTAGVIWVP